MKWSPLFPQVALVFAVAYACSDSAAPANSHAILAPNNPTGQFGEPPPPPVDVAIAVTISSTPVTAIFTGVFFNNGLIHDDGVGSTPTFDGTAWLRFDNKQPDAVDDFFSGTVSANARFMVKDLNTPTGHGTFTIDDVDYTIVSVQNFTRLAGCGEVTASPCASIQFTVAAEGEPCDPVTGVGCHRGNLVAFEESECLVDDPKFGLEYNCPLPGDEF